MTVPLFMSTPMFMSTSICDHAPNSLLGQPTCDQVVPDYVHVTHASHMCGERGEHLQ